ncbi:MAG TPA: hypothetical protein VMB77_07840 [Syntrophales bacterium]|nr:hypothetical protein [Syntrophales bacterium]
MAVLVEALCVVVRRGTIDSKYPGGWEKFVADHGTLPLCADEKIVRLGFTSPMEMRILIREMEKLGFEYMKEGKSAEIAIVDQSRGFMAPCDWLEYGHVTIGDGRTRIAACRLAGCPSKNIVLPLGWTYRHSLSDRYRSVPPKDPVKA